MIQPISNMEDMLVDVSILKGKLDLLLEDASPLTKTKCQQYEDRFLKILREKNGYRR